MAISTISDLKLEFPDQHWQSLYHWLKEQSHSLGKEK
jgi:hypothetical protein